MHVELDHDSEQPAGTASCRLGADGHSQDWAGASAGRHHEHTRRLGIDIYDHS